MTDTSALSTTAPDFPIVRQCPYRPPAEFGQLRSHGPLTRMRLHDGRAVWVITGYAEARALLGDERVSADRWNPSQPSLVPVSGLAKLREQTDNPIIKLGTTLLGADPPEHSRHRRLLTASFSVRRIAALRPRIQRIVDERLDAMDGHGPPADLVRDFALPVPSMVICELLGVPYADHDFFEEQSRLRLDPERAAEAVVALWEYVDGLVTTRKAEPGEGVIDDLIAQEALEGKLDREELVACALILLIAGHDTTANMLSLGTLALLEHPDQLEALRSGDAPIAGAVEELLRYLAIIGATTRVATADIELAGQVIAAGEGIVIALAPANQDEAIVERPDVLDVHRSPRHVAFGYGIHQCLGQNLARVEMEIAFRSLLDRFPTLRLAVPADEVRPRPGLLAGLFELPVAW